jgi:hypothetical protein
MTARVQPAAGQDEQLLKQKRLEDLEAKAVAEAKASADASFKPSPSLLNAASAEVLMSQVDGPSLLTYEGKESVYVGRSVPITAGGKLDVPIQVTSPGSVVEYFIEIHSHDISIGITAERDEGTTVVKVCFLKCFSLFFFDFSLTFRCRSTCRYFGTKSPSRVDSSASPLTQKFLVGTVPCLINFEFDNA